MSEPNPLMLGLCAAAVATVSAVTRAREWDRERPWRFALPNLYADSKDAFEDALGSVERAEALAESVRVMVLPFGGPSEREHAIARGASENLRRELMRIEGLSVASAVDSPRVVEPDDAPMPRGETFVIRGRGEVFAEHRVEISVSLRSVNGESSELSASGREVPELLADLLEKVAKAAGARRVDAARLRTFSGRPRHFDGLAALGALAERAGRAHTKDVGPSALVRESEAIALLREEPTLAATSGYLGRHRMREMLELFARVPDDPELCAHLFRAAEGFPKERDRAWQFVRRALELCPTHRRMNLAAVWTAEHPSRLGHLSRLASQLQPEDPLFLAHHAAWWLQHGREPRAAAELAQSTVDRFPHHPWSHGVLTDALEQLGALERAVEAARNHLALLSPPIHPVTDRASLAAMSFVKMRSAEEVEGQLLRIEQKLGTSRRTS